MILITGVSSGFGKECSRLLAEKGHKVYGTVRAEGLQDGLVNLLKMDLTDLPSIIEAVRKVVDNEGRIDVLINNAGMHTGGPAETIPEEFFRLQMETNFTGMVNLTRQVLPVMRRQGGGLIINFSSIGGLMGLPFQAFYSASKFAVEGFSEALRMEVAPFKIKILVINPGDFNTGNTKARRNFMAPTGEDDPYNSRFMRALEVIENDEISGRKPVILARKIARIVESRNPRQRYIISAFYEKTAVALKYLLPARLFRYILEKNYRLK